MSIYDSEGHKIISENPGSPPGEPGASVDLNCLFPLQTLESRLSIYSHVIINGKCNTEQECVT